MHTLCHGRVTGENSKTAGDVAARQLEVERSPAVTDDDRRLNCEHVDEHQHNYILNKSAIFVNKKKLCMLGPRCGSDTLLNTAHIVGLRWGASLSADCGYNPG